MVDFQARASHVEDLCVETNMALLKFNIGKLFNPESFLIATRRVSSLKLGVSMEKLEPVFSTLTATDATQLFNLSLEGAEWRDSTVAFTSRCVTKMPGVYLSWNVADDAIDAKSIELPLFLREDRLDLLMFVKLIVAGKMDELKLRERSVVLACESMNL